VDVEKRKGMLVILVKSLGNLWEKKRIERDMRRGGNQCQGRLRGSAGKEKKGRGGALKSS